ncbi:hypothetical protein DFP75_104106 [Marinomonas alcarazii]|uniref:Uncharacterized protein n=1 Tax=Marinomonas alcarazii TaxID=491949 RepID=A0A318UYI6_9GAMM|nr:hypothetical protein [Marinomonas alcarazii]PYF81646.1 hypothetical protein DFP75_104106 [Marinomonas alcarazii]
MLLFAICVVGILLPICGGKHSPLVAVLSRIMAMEYGNEKLAFCSISNTRLEQYVHVIG